MHPDNPLAVLEYGKNAGAGPLAASPVRSAHAGGMRDEPDAVDGGELVVLRAPMQGTIVSLAVREGETVRAGQPLLIMNAMKMEHVVAAPASGVVRRLAVAEGETVPEGSPLVVIEARDVPGSGAEPAADTDLDHVRADLGEALERHAVTRDDARPDAVARRQATGQRTARENIDDLCDPGTFVEYGALAVAAQRQRRSIEDLIARTPAES